jgi:hypothetical protein
MMEVKTLFFSHSSDGKGPNIICLPIQQSEFRYKVSTLLVAKIAYVCEVHAVTNETGNLRT